MIDKYLSEIVPGKASRTQDDYRAYCTKLKHSLGHMLPDEIGITDLYDYHRPTGLRLAMLLSGSMTYATNPARTRRVINAHGNCWITKM